MYYLAARVEFDCDMPQVGGDLIGAVFQEFGLQGVVIDDPTPDPQVDWADDALELPPRHAVTGYLPLNTASDSLTDMLCRRLESRLQTLSHHSGITTRIAYHQVDEQDWAESWKPFFTVQRIGRRLVIKPSWQTFRPEHGDCVIELDPGMAFGTGTHPTTTLCLELLEKYLTIDHDLLDVGTGSGILLAAAAQLCRGRLCGVDNDPVAAGIARANLQRNGVPRNRFMVINGHLVDCIRTPFGAISANILTPVIVQLVPRLRRVCKPGGMLICSGILEPQYTVVQAALAANAFTISEVAERQGWVAVAACYNQEIMNTDRIQTWENCADESY